MKKIHSILAIFAVLVLASSCEKYLDLEPYQYLDESVALNSDANVKSVLVGAYAVLRGDINNDYGANTLRNSELSGGTGEISWQGTYNGPREIINHQINPANGDITRQWMQSYECINICNNVLSALQVVDSADRGRVEGEALFLRSLMYFELVRFYAIAYQPGANNSQLGVPLILTPTNGVNDGSYVGRNTVQQVYDQVVSDLNDAVSLLPEKDPDNETIFATKGAANALLARVYLQQGDYANARDAADAVISSGLYSLTPTYAEAFNNTDFTSEDIFGTKFISADGINQMTEFWSTTDYGGRSGDIEILDGHLSLYQVGDTRFDLFWEGNDAMRSGKWNTMYGVIGLFRLAEMYLIRAEANFREGTAVGAQPVDDFNMVHERAGLAPLTSIILDDILLERRLELAHEGFKIHDMKRLQQNVGNIPYDDPRLVYPIPAREISANPELANQQNEGY